jgi:hypothetical protein
MGSTPCVLHEKSGFSHAKCTAPFVLRIETFEYFAAESVFLFIRFFSVYSVMKPFLRLLAVATLMVGLTSCLFKEPIFTGGFLPTDPDLAGVWMADDENADARNREFAVISPVGSDAFTLNYPVGNKGGNYFEARPLKVAGKDIWQVQLTVTFEDGVPKKDTPTYTLLQVEKVGTNQLKVRSLKSEGDHTASAAATQKALSGDKSPDWDKLFGEAHSFTRLKDR